MDRALLLDIEICESSAILQLLARKDEPLLIARNALLVGDLRFYTLDCVARLNLECDRLPCESLDKDLHF